MRVRVNWVMPDEQIAYEVPIILPEMLDDYLARHAPIGSLDHRFFFLDE